MAIKYKQKKFRRGRNRSARAKARTALRLIKCFSVRSLVRQLAFWGEVERVRKLRSRIGILGPG
jgi:hypothetical protein